MSIVNEALKKVTREEKWVPQAEGKKFTFSAKRSDRNRIAIVSILSIFFITIIGLFGMKLIAGLPSKVGSEVTKLDTPIAIRIPNQTKRNLNERKDGIPNIGEEASRINQEGLELYRSKKFNEAKELFQKVISLQPDNAIAHNNLGLIYMEEGRERKAETRYKAALKENPNYPEALNNLALLYSKEGNYEEAIRLYRRAIRIKPDYPDSHLNIAILLERSGYIEEAKKHYNSYIEYAPKGGNKDISKVKYHLSNLS